MVSSDLVSWMSFVIFGCGRVEGLMKGARHKDERGHLTVLLIGYQDVKTHAGV